MSVEYEYPGGVRVTHLGRQMDQCTNRSSITLQGSRGRATLDFGHAKIGETSPSSMIAGGCNRLSSSMPI